MSPVPPAVPLKDVLSPGLKTSIDKAVADLAKDQRGKLTAGASLTGVEIAIAQRGPFGMVVGGYAKRMWGGGFEAGARAQIGW